jgi:hypothetical protein
VEHVVRALEHGAKIDGAEIAFDQLEARLRHQGRQVRAFELPAIVRCEAINAHDLVPLGNKVFGEMRSDEPGDSRHDTAWHVPLLQFVDVL